MVPRLIIILAASSLCAGATRAQFCPQGVTDPSAIFPEARSNRPPYLTAFYDSVFHSKITRIAADSGQVLPGISTRHWGSHARHHYSKDEPWNSTGSMLMIDNTVGADNISKVVLDGTNYAVLVPQPCVTWSFEQDSRWHSSKAWPSIRVGVSYDKNKDSNFDPQFPVHDSLYWADVSSQCATIRAWRLPIRPHLLGQGEGNMSFDGRWIAVSTNHKRFASTATMPDSIVVIDMNPPAPGDYASGARRIGPPYEIPACGLSAGVGCAIGNISVSASGHYIDVKYDKNGEYHRIFSVDSTTLAIQPVTMATESYRCFSSEVASNTSGWILPLKHADMTLDPDDNLADVIIGGADCDSNVRTDSTGKVAKVRLSDGHVTFLSQPGLNGYPREGFFRHASTRCQDRLGWVYVNYDTLDTTSTSPRRFSNEVVAYAIDGSHRIQRFGYLHAFEFTQASSPPEATDDDEAQPVPSRDGTRIVFASNWALKTINPPSQKQYNSYVLDASNCATADAPRLRPRSTLALGRPRPNPSRGEFLCEVSLPDSKPARLAILDIAGRVVERRTIDRPGAGAQMVAIGTTRRVGPGMYFVLLEHPSGKVRQTVVVLR